MTVLGMKMRIACSSLIYRNILTVRKRATSDLTMGQMVNLLSNDVGKFDDAFTFFQYMWIAPLEIAVGVVYMDVKLGHTALVGVVFLTLCLLFQTYISKKIFQKRRQIALKTDKRVCLVNDVVSGIRAIKMYAWEDYFIEVIEKARSAELKKVTTANYYRLGINSFKLFSTPVSVFLGIITLMVTKSPITPQYLYTMETMYESLALSVIILVPVSLVRVSEVSVSIERIQEFLLKTDTTSEVCTHLDVKTHHQTSFLRCYNIFQEGPHCISLRNVSAKWHSSSQRNVLSNITFTAHFCDLIGVVGPAGGGKTTLLQAILKEIQTCGGTMDIHGTISYASQEPWIFSGSIRQNILFGEDLDVEKYHVVVQICCLEHDIFSLPQGDGTIVGERGAMLSGGQKARINLARAIYREADIYLLDDPLSAVDVHVARQIFDNCILNYLKTKCVVLVTHQARYLQTATKIYVLEDGKIRDCGKYGKVVGLKDTFVDENETTGALSQALAPLKQHNDLEEFKEHRSSGRNSVNIYKRYCLSAGHWTFTILVLLLLVLLQTLVNACDYFLSLWVNVKNLMEHQKKLHFFELYIIILGSIIITAFCTVWLIVRYNINVSKNLHQHLLSRTIHNTIAFFNQNSSGRILNRFTKDMGCTDEMLPMAVMNVLTGLLLVFGSIVLVSLTNYWVILISLTLVLITCLCAFVFQATNRNLKRTEGTTKSHVLAHVTATVQGLATIRASGAQEVLSREFDKHQELHTSASYLLTALYCALGFWTDLLSAIYVGVVTFGFLLIPNDASAGFIGLAITQATALVGLFQYLIKVWAEVEIHMTSVERVLEYIDLPTEPDNGNLIPPPSWPLAGNITLDTISMKYLPNQNYALKRLCVQIQAGQKIGIVGRTGAGKSSLISALFRLFDFEGAIFIDGIDTKCLPLKHLRSNISIIPQDPILFSGSLRRNIDPWNKYPDSKIWSALEEFNLKQTVSSLPLGLDMVIAEGGSNFSVGQKQLLCLLRSVLQNNKIVVLDEATANVDLKTDEVIQDIIRKKFAGNSDKILVLEDGKIVEFDDPLVLLQNPEGAFYRYAKENGLRVTRDAIVATKSVKN
ncbi:ATP-binding cassette sub-family C member 4-like [Zophobas morio]|uniref:ATP-binding cassette sub-family C member 4-like n=1 Tax=Zophobas morio TaxID=2755281 RepID=UPI0030830719